MTSATTVPAALPADFVQSEKFRTLVHEFTVDQAEKDHAARAVLQEQLREAEHGVAEAVERRDKAVKPLEVAQVAARTAHDAAVAKLRDARREHSHRVLAQIAKREEIKRRMTATASPAINEARKAMWKWYEEHRNGIAEAGEVATGGLNSMTLRPIVRAQSNAAAIARLVGAMRLADLALDNLKLANPKDVDAAIAEALAPVLAARLALRELTDVG